MLIAFHDADYFLDFAFRRWKKIIHVFHFSTNHNQTGTKNYLIQLTFSTLNIDPFQQSRPEQPSKPPFLTLCFVVQMAKTIQLHYLDMLPLTHASEDVLDELTDVQMNVGNLAYLSHVDWTWKSTTWSVLELFLTTRFMPPLSLFRLSFSAVVSIRATWIGATTFQNPAYVPRNLLNHVWVFGVPHGLQLRPFKFCSVFAV